MNFNVWNIKEMLSTPSGSGNIKSSNWNNNQNDCSALSDSQFLFGSQFCPENSETLSAPLDFGIHVRYPKQTQQNSLESEPSIFTKYQTKPQLFGGETKDEGLFSLPLPVGNSKGFLKQFEEKKKRTTDKCDSETLLNFVSHFGESIHKLQTSVEKSEEHLSSRSQSILDSLETVVKTFQETVQAQSNLMVEAVQDKGNMEQVILEIQKESEARQAEFIEMKSCLKNLEVLASQQSKDFQQLSEQVGQLSVSGILEELSRFISMPQAPRHVKDNKSQTSPSLARNLNFTRQEKSTSEEPVSWQIQVAATAGSPSMGSQKAGLFGVWDEGAQTNILQKATLPAVGPHERNGHVKDKTMQSYRKNWTIFKTSPQNHSSNIPDQKICGNRDLISQEYSQLDFTTNIKNVGPKYQSRRIFSCDPYEQKGKGTGRGRKGKKLQPRKSCRSQHLSRKQEQTPSKTCAFNSWYQNSQSPVSGPQEPLTLQQEPLAQLLHSQGPKTSTNPVLGETFKTSQTRAAQRSLLQSTRYLSKDKDQSSGSSQGDQEISWFSNLCVENAEPPQCQKSVKNLLCDLVFDSSDDDS